jgi:hypothetical protein
MLEKHPVGHQSAAAPSGNVSSAWAMAGLIAREGGKAVSISRRLPLL